MYTYIYIHIYIYIYIYVFIELQADVLIFSQLAWLPSSSTRNFRSGIVQISRFVLISKCTMGAFIVPLS